MYREKVDRQKIENNQQLSSLRVNLSYTNDSYDISKHSNNVQCRLSKEIGCDNNNDNNNRGSGVDEMLSLINQKDQALNDSCSRLREAILTKTRELFHNQNDFCSKTIEVLQTPAVSNQQIQQNALPMFSKPCNSTIAMVSPRRTRSSTARILKNNLMATQSQFNKFLNESLEDSINFGVPVMCSTFTDHHCNIHESCNREIRDINNINIQRISGNQLQPSVSETLENIVLPTSPAINILPRPVVRSVESCHIDINKLAHGMKLHKKTILQPESMELTDAQGKIFHESVNENNPDNKKSQPDFSMYVNTSLDIINRHDNPKPDEVDNPQGNAIVKNISNLALESTPANVIPNRSTTIYCNTINIINSSSVMEIDDQQQDMSVVEISKSVPEKNISIDKNANSSRRESTDSIVEGTPEPRAITSRSQVLLNNTKKIINIEKMVDKVVEKEMDEMEDTIVLDELPLTSTITRNSKGTIVIQETSDDGSDDENSQPVKKNNLTTSNLIRRKKLFTQRNSPVSISCSPASQTLSPMLPVRRKQTRKRRLKKHNILPENVRRSDRLLRTNTGLSSRSRLSSISTAEHSSPLAGNEEKREKKKKRLIKSKKIVVKKPIRINALSTLNTIENNCKSDEDTTTQIPRGSDVFMEQNKILKRRRTHNTQSIIIVTTGLSNRDREWVKQAMRKIAGAKIESVVTRKTTHVVTAGARTINLLRGMIRGCWIVKLEWVKRSIDAGRWLNAEKYEIDHLSKAIKENRRDKEIFGSAYVSELFATCGLIYIETCTAPPCEILKELIKTASGQLTEDRRKAKVIIGPQDIKEIWILDSIVSGELLPINKYKS